MHCHETHHKLTNRMTFKPPGFIATLACIFALNAFGGDKPVKTVTAAFSIAGLECGSCAYSVQYQLTQTPGVVEVEMIQELEDLAVVSYKPEVISEHQIAQSVREAIPLHGTPYIATLKIRIPGHATKAAEVKALLDQWKSEVQFDASSTEKDEWLVGFRELAPGLKGLRPQGWTLAKFSQGLRGLGLKVELVSPPSSATLAR